MVHTFSCTWGSGGAPAVEVTRGTTTVVSYGFFVWWVHVFLMFIFSLRLQSQDGRRGSPPSTSFIGVLYRLEVPVEVPSDRLQIKLMFYNWMA